MRPTTGFLRTEKGLFFMGVLKGVDSKYQFTGLCPRKTVTEADADARFHQKNKFTFENQNGTKTLEFEAYFFTIKPFNNGEDPVKIKMDLHTKDTCAVCGEEYTDRRYYSCCSQSCYREKYL